jgi:hypothetical protein
MNATKTVPVCCQVCKRAATTTVVKDFAFKVYYACPKCIRRLGQYHPSKPMIVS